MPHNKETDKTKQDLSYTNVENANDILEVEEIQPSTLETIDFAFYEFVNDYINNMTNSNEGWKKTSVIWTSAERSFLSKNNKDLRDDDGTLILPLITIERTSIQKDLNRKGAYFGAAANFIDPKKGGRITLARKIVPDKTNNFSVADNIKRYVDVNNASTINTTPGNQAYFPRRQKNGSRVGNKKVIYETLSIPIPVFLSVNYAVILRTEYLQQMNELTMPFATLGGHINSFAITKDGHRYEVFVQSNLALDNNVSNMGANERIYKTQIDFEVLGYIIGDGPNRDRSKIIKQQNAVEVKIPREHVILGDIPDYIDNRGFYKE